MGHKRKRESQLTSVTGSADTVPNSKRPKVESAAVSAADRRQLRSERKSKKASAARDGASKKIKTPLEPHAAPEYVKADDTSPKDLMTADFISLTEPSSVNASGQENAGSGSKASKKEKKKDKKEDKRKSYENTGDPLALNTSSSKPPPDSTRKKRPSPRSLRKEAKAQKAQSAVLAEYGQQSTGDATSENANNTAAKKTSKAAPKPRFICFVGNLPYDCTLEQLQIHFRALNPSQIRHATNKATGKSKGYAFLEFDEFDKMKTCLKVYHHSIFDPERTAQLPDEAFDADGSEIKKGNSKRIRGRRINVELTAGGGGGSENRKEKITQKNQKLNEERARRKAAEAKVAKKAENKTGEQTVNETAVEQDNAAIHPSRLKKMRH